MAGKKKPRLRDLGELVRIPIGKDEWAVVVYLGKHGSFGHAFGVCDGIYSLSDFDKGWVVQGVSRFPFFCGDRSVGSGRWVVFGKDTEAAKRFEYPHYYYHPNSTMARGEGYGMCEKHGEKPRSLSREEFEVVFSTVPEGSHSNSLTEPELERFLWQRGVRYN